MTSRILSLLLLSLFLVSCAAPVEAPAAPPPTDTAPAPTTAPISPPASFEHSLPAVRWDTKTRRYLLAPVDPASGVPAAGRASIDLGVNYYHAYSPAGSTLVIISYPDDTMRGPVLHILDLAAWKEVKLPLDLDGYISAITFSPDGSRLAAASSGRVWSLLAFDLAAEKVTAQVETDFEINHLSFTQDGSGLMTFGRRSVDRFTENERADGPARAALLDASDLSLTWAVELTGVFNGIYPVDEAASTAVHSPGGGRYFYPGAAFEPGEDVLYIVHAESEKLTRVDFAARRFDTQEIKPRLTLLERFLMLGASTAHAKAGNGVMRQAVIPPGSKFLYTVGTRDETLLLESGDWEFNNESLGLQTIRLRDGAVVREEKITASGLDLSEIGAALLVRGWDASTPEAGMQTYLMDLRSSTISGVIAGTHLYPVRCMDGSRLLAAHDPLPNTFTRLRVYSEDGTEPLHDWIYPGSLTWLIEQ